MPDRDFQNFSKSRATNMAGHIVYFREEEHSERRLGRVVGYYYDMAQIIMECGFKPKHDVDPRMTPFTLTANFRSGTGWWYCLVDPFWVDDNRQKDSRYPHACPRCGLPAFVMFRTVECSKYDCPNYKAQS